jgi:chorismate dehydratase
MLRVGAVSYLNAKPLCEGLVSFGPGIDLTYDLPSRIADQMAAGRIDVGLIPVFEHFKAGDYGMIPGIGIACRGPVLSVTLFSREPWARIRTVSLDEGSRTSAALTKLILRDRHGLDPQFEKFPIDLPADDLSTDAVLMIGDRAMKACLPGYRYAYDLGEEWTNWTGLPMVFAVWSVRPGINIAPYESAFQRAKEFGIENAGMIAEREAPALSLDAGFCRRYLSNVIRYDLGPDEVAGFNLFREKTQSMRSSESPRPREIKNHGHESIMA